MAFSEDEERRIVAMTATMTAIARGTVPPRYGILNLRSGERIGASRAGVVSAVAAMVGAVAGGAALGVHYTGIADHLRAPAEHTPVSIQAIPDAVMPASIPVASPTQVPHPGGRHRGWHVRSVASRPRQARSGGAAPVVARPAATADQPADAALRQSYVEDARQTREQNERQLQDGGRR